MNQKELLKEEIKLPIINKNNCFMDLNKPSIKLVKDLLKYYKCNKQEMYKLIEIRNNFKDTKLEYIRNELIKFQLNKILNLCKNKEVYILGHNNPDADSIISSYILSNILKSMGINAHFCILDNNYEYTYHDRKLLNDNFKYHPEIIHDLNKKYILVDHNDLQGLSKDNVIGAIDHHIIKNEIDNILEIEYASTSLLIYDLFKNKYKFNEEEKYLIGLATLSDTEYLTSSRFTEFDKILYEKLDLNIDVKVFQKKYFITTDFSNSVDENILLNKKEYLMDGKKIVRVLITSYDDCKLDEYINRARELDYLLMWINYDNNTTTIYYSNNIIKLDYILSSTYLVFKLLDDYKIKERK